MSSKVKAGFVKTENGQIFVQIPDDNEWGFSICDDDQTWAGGFGCGSKTFTLLSDADPEITEEDHKRLDWILEEHRTINRGE